MEIGQIVGYVLLGLFVLFALIGFFIGMARGARKSVIRIVVFIASTVAAFALTPMFSKILMSTTIKIGDFTLNIAEEIAKYTNAEPIAVDLIENSTTLQSFYSRTPYIVMNLATFFLLFIVISFIGFILYLIIKPLFLKKKPKAWRQEGTYQVDLTKTKKRKFLGGLISAVQSIAFLTLLLLPITGVASTLYDLAYQKQKVSHSTEIVYTPTAEIFQNNIPAEFLDVLNAYKSSPLYISSKVLGTDSFLFDLLTTVKIKTSEENLKISYRSELLYAAELYNNLDFFTHLDFENVVYKNLPYDKINKAVNTVFASKMLKAVMPEVIDWMIIDINRPENESLLQLEVEPEIVDMINSIVDEYKLSGGIYKGITNDLKVIFNVAANAGKSGLVDEVIANELDFDKIKTILLANQRKVVNDTFGKLFNATALRFVAVELINELLAEVSTPNVTFTPVEFKKVVWRDVNTDITSILNNAIDIYVSASDEFSGNLIEVIEDNPYELLYADTDVLTQKLGELMTTLQNTNLLVDKDGNKVIYGQFMDYLNNTDLKKYIDFNHFKAPNTWKNEMQHFNILLSAVKNSGILSEIVNNIDDFSKIDANSVLNKLSKFDTNSKTYTHNIVVAILESKAFSKIINLGFEELNTLIAENQNWFGEGTNIGSIQYDKLNLAQEKINTVIFFDNLVSYANSIDLSKLESDPVSTIFSSNLSKLGIALDAIKNSALFGAYVQDGVPHDGVYKSLINALDANAQFSDFANFAVALENDFIWNSEFSNIQAVLDKMKTIKINGKPLLDKIIEGDDLADIFDGLSSSDIDEIIDPLVESKLLAKNVAVFVNTVNKQITDLTGVSIADVSSANVILQKEDVKKVLKQMLSLSDILTSSLNETSLKANAQAIGQLLNTLKLNESTYEHAVFGETYNALVSYLKSDANFGSEITALVDEYEDAADIDWQKLLNLFIEFENQNLAEGFSQTFKELFSSIFATMKKDQSYAAVTTNVLELMTDLTNIKDLTDFKALLAAYSVALEGLAEAQNDFAENNPELQLEYYNKVKTVLDLFKELSNENIVSKLTQITVYQTEINSANAIVGLIDEVELVEASTPLNEMEQLAENLINALANSQLLLNLMVENNESYQIENVTLKNVFKTKIESSGHSLQKQADLKTFFKITD